RACQNLVLGAKARAVMNGRPNVSIADVKAVAVPVLRHRVFTNFAADAEGVTPMALVEELVKTLPEPKVDHERELEREAEAPRERERERPSAPREREAAPPAPAREAAATSAPPKEPSTSIIVRCPKCAKAMKLPAKAVGRKAKCQACGEVFPVE